MYNIVKILNCKDHLKTEFITLCFTSLVKITKWNVLSGITIVWSRVFVRNVVMSKTRMVAMESKRC